MNTSIVDPKLLKEAEKHVAALYNESIKQGDEQKKIDSLRHLLEVITFLK